MIVSHRKSGDGMFFNGDYTEIRFFFFSSAFGVISFKKALPNPRFQKFALMFSYKNRFYI